MKVILPSNRVVSYVIKSITTACQVLTSSCKSQDQCLDFNPGYPLGVIAETLFYSMLWNLSKFKDFCSVNELSG